MDPFGETPPGAPGPWLNASNFDFGELTGIRQVMASVSSWATKDVTETMRQAVEFPLASISEAMLESAFAPIDYAALASFQNFMPKAADFGVASVLASISEQHRSWVTDVAVGQFAALRDVFPQDAWSASDVLAVRSLDAGALSRAAELLHDPTMASAVEEAVFDPDEDEVAPAERTVLQELSPVDRIALAVWLATVWHLYLIWLTLVYPEVADLIKEAHALPMTAAAIYVALKRQAEG